MTNRIVILNKFVLVRGPVDLDKSSQLREIGNVTLKINIIRMTNIIALQTWNQTVGTIGGFTNKDLVIDQLREKITQLEFQLKHRLDPNSKIGFPSREGTILLDKSNIVYLKANSNYTHIITEKGKNLIISKTLKYVENLLPNNSFLRIHQSYIVNKQFITMLIKHHGTFVQLENDIKLPVSRTKKEHVLHHLNCNAYI